MLRPLVVAIILLIIVGLIASFIIWGDEIKLRISEWRNPDNKTTTTQSVDNKNTETAGITSTDKTTDTKTTDKTKTTNVTKDKTLLSNDNLVSMNKKYGCEIEFNDDLANETVDFDGLGIQAEIPFNENWGSAEFRLLPYEINANHIDFGKMFVFEACSWTRQYTLERIGQRTLDEAKKYYKSQGLSDGQIKVTKLNGFNVIEVNEVGICEHPAVEIFGPEYNYVASAVCSVEVKRDFEALRGVIKSISFNGLMLGLK